MFKSTLTHSLEFSESEESCEEDIHPSPIHSLALHAEQDYCLNVLQPKISIQAIWLSWSVFLCGG